MRELFKENGPVVLFDRRQPIGSSTEYKAATTYPKERPWKPVPRIDKNGSDGSAVIDNSGPVSFESTSKTEFSEAQSALGAYERRGPCFDRVTACKTNYSLATPETLAAGPAGTTTERFFTDPASRPKVEQPILGGWRAPNGGYKCDALALDVVRRGGGGGMGALGMDFNIVTGESHAYRDPSRFGPKNSVNAHPRLGARANDFDLLSGRPKRRYVAPPAPTPASLRRPDTDLLRTRPW